MTLSKRNITVSSQKKAFVESLCNESIYTKIDIEDYKVYLENMWEEINQRISEEVFPNLKYQLNLLVEFSKSTPNDEQFTTAWFNSGEFFQLRNHSLMNKLTKS